MDLYRPPLRETSRKEHSTALRIEEAVEGLKIVFYYTGQRLGKELISLTVLNMIEDNSENVYLRLCTYTGLKENWKVVIISQVKHHLQSLNVEEGFVRSETRYMEVTPKNYLSKESFEKKYSSLKEKVNNKKNEDDSL